MIKRNYFNEDSNEVVEEYESVLACLYEERIFTITLSPDKKEAVFEEACDGYFSTPLTKPDVARLIEELTAIKEQMGD